MLVNKYKYIEMSNPHVHDDLSEEYDLDTEIKFKSQWALHDGRQDIVDIMNMMAKISTIESQNKLNHMKDIISRIIKLIESHDFMWFTVRSIFNACIGYAIPSDKAIQTLKLWVLEYQKVYPDAKLVDLGAFAVIHTADSLGEQLLKIGVAHGCLL
jgi:hypothetical protein